MGCPISQLDPQGSGQDATKTAMCHQENIVLLQGSAKAFEASIDELLDGLDAWMVSRPEPSLYALVFKDPECALAKSRVGPD